MNLNEIEFALSKCVTASSSNLDLLAYARAVQQLRTGAMFTVACCELLPAASSNNGKLYLVENIQRVVFSNCLFWNPIATFSTSGWTWGSNVFGQLGTNNTTNRSSPVQEITLSTNWRQFSAAQHVVGLKNDGSLWAWGSATCGKLGNNNTVDRSCPVREISSSLNWCSVTAGGSFTAAVKSNNTLWLWGAGRCGQLAQNNLTSFSSPVQEITSSTTWCIASAGGHALAIKSDGTLWAWGSNAYGALGLNDTIDKSSPIQEVTSSTNWCVISAGSFLSVGLKNDGTLWGWGRNNDGQLGTNSTSDASSPVREISSSTTWCAISAKLDTVALKTNNTLWAWGLNACGSLGDNTTTSRSSPIQEATSATTWCQISNSGSSNTTALQTDGSLWAWGNGYSGQLGNNLTSNRLIPVREISSSSNWAQVVSGSSFTVARKII